MKENLDNVTVDGIVVDENGEIISIPDKELWKLFKHNRKVSFEKHGGWKGLAKRGIIAILMIVGTEVAIRHFSGDGENEEESNDFEDSVDELRDLLNERTEDEGETEDNDETEE